jgi:hypothetical protein
MARSRVYLDTESYSKYELRASCATNMILLGLNHAVFVQHLFSGHMRCSMLPPDADIGLKAVILYLE